MKKNKDKNKVELDPDQKQSAISDIKDYMPDNFDIEIGNLQSEIFLDYISENIGTMFYNKGVADSIAAMSDKVNDLYILMKDEPDKQKNRQC